MVRIENALGKKIQITNSNIYSDLREKKDLLTGLDYESLLLSMGNLSSTLGKYVNADSEKIKFYVSLYGLGCIDGGKVALDYFNSKVYQNNKITNYDIMLNNLKKIFPNPEQKFTEDELSEFSQLFSNSVNVNEVYVIKIIYYLKLAAQNYKKMGRFDEASATEFIFNEMQKIIGNYSKTGRLGISKELNDNLNNLFGQKYELDEFRTNELNEIIRNYNINLNKDNAIEKLNKLKAEKKTKIR